MTRRLTDHQISDVADDLRGTTQDIGAVLRVHGVESFDELTEDDCFVLDSIVLLCELCGWWCDSDEMEDDLCDECQGPNG